MKQKLLKSMLLLCALVLGGASNLWATGYEELFTIKSSDVVTNSSYAAYNTTVSSRDFVITFGGNNKSVGTNSSNRSKCKLSDYSKYAVSPVTTSSIASAFACKTSISDVSKISYTFNGGSNQTNTNVYLLYSSDNSSFSQVSLTSGTQGAAISSGTAYEFEAKTGYFALLFEATNSSGNWRIDDVNVTFYKEASGGGSDPSISLSSNTIETTEAAKEGTINVTYNNLTDYASEVIFYESNGTTPATYDHSWLTAGINSTTKNLEYSITANTGAARTAYMRVYVVDNTLGELYSPVITVTQAAKTVVAPEYNLEGNKRYWQGTEITLTSVGNTIYYNMTTDGTDPATPTSGSTLYSEPIALGNSTAKIWAIAYDTYGNKSSVVKRTYTGVAPATLPFSWDEKSTTTTGIICSTGVGTYNSSPYLKISETGQNIILKFDEVPGTLSFDIKGNTFSGGTFKVQTSADGETYSDLKVYTSLGDKTTESFVLAGTVRYIKWIYTEKSNGNVALGNIKAYKCESIILNASGYATFAANVPLDFSDDSEFSAWQITGVNGTAITFSQITGAVAAGTGVLLKGTASATVNIPVAASGTDISSTNKLTGITTATAVNDNQYYGLSDNKFVKVNAGTVPAGKALLPVSAVGAGVKEFTFIFDDKETGIRTIEKVSAEEAAQIFDLSGRRLSKMQKGINIVNGKKILF